MGTLKVNGNIEVNKLLGNDIESGLVIQSKSSAGQGWGEGVYIIPHSNGFATLTLGPTDRTSGCALVYHGDTASHYLEVKTNNGKSFQSTIPYANGVLLNSGNYTSYTVTKTGGGASGTWGINISGNSNTVGGYQASSFLLKTGGTMTGNLTAPTYIATQKMTISSTGLVDLTAAGTTRLYADGIAISNPSTKNDDAWIRVTGTGENDTILEIATGDDGGGTADTGPEQIVVRQYGAKGLAHQITLMDTSGNTSTSGTITASSFIGNLNGNASSATNADKLDGYHASSFALSGHTHNYLPWNIYSGATDFNTVTTTAFNSMCATGGANQPNPNHGLLITDFNVGTPIQIWYPDLSMAMYKRYRSSGTWSAWSNTWDINISGTAAAASSVAWGNVTGKPSSFTPASHTHSYLPLGGGTMSGTITLANTGLRTPAESGYYTDQHGNFYHQNTAATSYWNIFNNAGTMSLQYYFETGVLHAPRPATSNYGGSLPSSGVAGEIFYKI